MKKYKIYIAGPYTHGDVAKNVADAIHVGDMVLGMGHTPFIPHLTHFWHLIIPRVYEAWMAYDIEWLKSCDALIRLPGASKGADREVEFAMKNNIPVLMLESGDDPYEVMVQLRLFLNENIASLQAAYEIVEETNVDTK